MTNEQVAAMEFGIFHEFLTTQTGSQQEAFRNSFAQIAAAEEWGLDVVWLAEIHMNPTRSLLSAPLTVAAAIREDASHQDRHGGADPAARPSAAPAEETATIDQISNGRLIFGIGRSAFPPRVHRLWYLL
jgi:alkanesulfonate monooxygenase SsuD/methylene tetrahydromethanopterin reductase-like flavin-dependent oxidoreductase (luciferase family)